MSLASSARMFPDRFSGKSVEMCHVNNARMCLGNNARMFQANSAVMFQDSNARMFPARRVAMSLTSNVAMFQDNSARMFRVNNANKFPDNNVLLPNRLMGNDEIFLDLPVFPALEAKREILNNFQNTRRKFYSRIFSLILISFRAFQSSQILLF